MLAGLHRGRILTALLTVAAMTATSLAREVRSLDRNWRFHLGDTPQAQSLDFDDAAWRLLDLPHDWSVEGDFSEAYASGTGFLPGGTGWYRKHFTLPTDQQGKRVVITFDGVYRNSEVWLNGVHLGERPYGYIGFHFDLTPHVRFGEDNVLAVCVRRENVADSRWYTGTGIYRHVWLTITDPLHVAPWGVFVTTPRITDESADVTVVTEVVNEEATARDIRVESRILDPDGKEVSSATTTHEVAAGATYAFTDWQQAPAPRRWSPDSPVLYTLVTCVSVGDDLRDEVCTRFGIRSIRFDPNKGLFLNDQPTKLRGLCMHHDAGVVGAAVPEDVLRRRLELVKSIGANAVRCSHNPMAPEFYRLCDEIGLLVMDEAFDEWEIGKRKWVQGRNNGTAERFGYSEWFEDWGERDAADMVRAHRNHPSIVMWSIGNEIDYPTDPYVHPESRVDPDFAGFEYRDNPPVSRLVYVAPKLIAAIKRNDPTRPVTMALANVPAANGTGLAAMLDIAGYNYQERNYAADHALFPNRVIFGSENGQQMESWRVVRDNAFVAGLFYWVGFDFLGEAGRWPWHGSTAGLFDSCGFKKPFAYHTQALWTKESMMRLYAAPSETRRGRRGWKQHHWNWRSGESVELTITAYSNCEEVGLTLNGRDLGRRKPAEAVAEWSVTYEAGELRATGYAGGEKVAEDVLVTAGAPVRLTAEVDRSTLRSPGSVAHVILSIVDEKGVRVTDFAEDVTVDVTGPGRLLGVDNGALSDSTPLRIATRRPRAGRLLALVQAGFAEGEILLTAQAEGIKQAEVALHSQATQDATKRTRSPSSVTP